VEERIVTTDVCVILGGNVVMEEKKITLIDYTGKEFSFSETDKFLSFLQEEIDFWRNISAQYNIAHESKYYKLLSNLDMKKLLSKEFGWLSKEFYDLDKNKSDDYFSIKNKINNNLIYLDDVNKTKNETLGKDNFLIDAYNKGKSDGFSDLLKNLLSGERKISLEWLYSKHFFTLEFCRCVTQYGDIAGDVFLNYILNKKITIEHLDYNNFNGLIDAFKTVNLEELGYNRLNKIATEFGNSKDLLVEEISNIKSGYEAWKDGASKEFQEKLDYIENCKVNCDESSKSILTECDNTLKETQAKAEKLEETYADKLRLSKPAEYWHKSAGDFLWQAELFGGLSLLLVIVPIIVLTCSGKEFIDSWFPSDPNANITYNIPRMGVIIFMLAIYTYLVRLVAKLTFSSLHLMRDAQEREQLTYVYLSLINENGIDEKSRDIVLQALFSRTETGLLANENGPTMPLSDVLQAMKK
jgi:hypothetical protein